MGTGAEEKGANATEKRETENSWICSRSHTHRGWQEGERKRKEINNQKRSQNPFSTVVIVILDDEDEEEDGEVIISPPTLLYRMPGIPLERKGPLDENWDRERREQMKWIALLDRSFCSQHNNKMPWSFL